MNKSRIFTRTIWTLAFVSLFTDVASEMLYPVMPIYLKSIGFTALVIGVLEGVASFVTGLSKGYFGKLSDEKGLRKPFVQLGYSISAIAKPLIVAFVSPIWVLFMRSSDRLGKGIRTGARDALLSDESSKENRGKVFGFHRAMDTTGATIGPILAVIYLYFHPGKYTNLFLYALVPGLIAITFTFFIREKKKQAVARSSKKGFFSYFNYWKQSSLQYKKLVTGLVLFALFNSSDIFLLLMARDIGISDTNVIGVYIFYNLVYALTSLPMGHLADKIGMKASFTIGLLLFAIVYGGMAVVRTKMMIFVLFLLYGLYSASTEGVSKAWISKLCPQNETGTGIGFFASMSSISGLVASILTGLLWVKFSPELAFAVIGGATVLILIYFLFFVRKTELNES